MNAKPIGNARNAFWCLKLACLVLMGVSAGRGQNPAPAYVHDCRPCTFSPGEGFPTYSFTFDLKTSGDGRTVEAIEVTSPGSDAVQQLPVTGMDPVGKDENFFFGGVDINFDGLLDLMLVTQQGGANADAAYWLFDPKTKTFKPLGTYPTFKVDKEKRRLTTYERGGSAGLSYESREYAFLDEKLTLMREEKQRATKDPDVFLKVIRERVDGVMKVVKTEKVPVPK